LSRTELIREANERDAAAVANLWTAAYVDEGKGGRTLPYSAADFFETARRGRVLVVERDGALVGVIALSAPGAPGQAVAQAGEAELSRLAVSAAARQEGIGRALVKRCHELAHWSRRYQTAAHRLYESLGYQRLPERDRADDSGHERLVFRREI
jgi:predicted N-acetyltransferase YhbS